MVEEGGREGGREREREFPAVWLQKIVKIDASFLAFALCQGKSVDETTNVLAIALAI